MSPTHFRGAVANADIKALSQISGLGKKTAERIVVELKDKIGEASAWEASSASRTPTPDESRLRDAAKALVAVGIKPADATESVRAAVAMLGDKATIEEIVRACLKKAA
jgi:Holliday junction DNA helicase RuvA